MATFKGEVAFVDERSGTTKRGRAWTAYSLKLKLENGELSEKLDAGFEKPAVKKGDYIEVVTEKNDRGYEAISSIKAAEAPKAKPVHTAIPNQAQQTAEVGADRQTQIVLQHSQEMAIAEVALLLEHEALPITGASTKAATAKRYEEIHQAIKKLTVELYNDVVTGRVLENVADAGVVDTSPDAAIPFASESSTSTAEDDE